MRKSRASRRRRKHDILRGVLALVLCVAAVGGAGYAWFMREGAVDRATLCPQAGPRGHVVVLVDQTDPLNFTQSAAFQRMFEDLIDHRVAPGQLVSVFSLGEDYRRTVTPLIELCNPGRGEGKSDLTANTRKLEMQFRERFRARLLEQREALIAAAPSKSSPIFEMLQLVAINSFRKHAVEGPRRLIIVSDMMHNTPGYSMYQGPPDFDAFAATDYGRRTGADLNGVEVELHYVLNAPRLQTRRQLQFWESWFRRSGARIAAVRPLEG
jgi:hypothetical protein